MLYGWLGAERGKRSIIAVDGKTICDISSANHKAYHVVSAILAESQITLGELAVSEKGNEITAVPETLDLINVTGRHRDHRGDELPEGDSAKNPRGKADFVVALQENHPIYMVM